MTADRRPPEPDPFDYPTLFDIPPATVDPESVEARFERFHEQHPEVYAELVRLTRLAVARGRERVGMAQLFEVLRWERFIAGLPDETETFKLNNNYRAFYARLIHELEPDLDGIFELRAMTVDRVNSRRVAR